MRLVSENSPEDIAYHRTSEQIRRALVDLTANILRVVRGAGKPEEIDHQALRFVQATIAHQELVGCLPHPSLYSSTLAFDLDRSHSDRVSDDERAERHQEENVIRASLQIIASQMLRQRTIQCTGENDLSDAIHRLVEIHEERRKKARAELRGTPKKRKSKDRPPLVF